MERVKAVFVTSVESQTVSAPVVQWFGLIEHSPALIQGPVAVSVVIQRHVPLLMLRVIHLFQ